MVVELVVQVVVVMVVGQVVHLPHRPQEVQVVHQHLIMVVIQRHKCQHILMDHPVVLEIQ